MEQATTDTTILIIEDHDAARLLMTNMFKKDYNNVVAKKDGIEALAWLAAGNIPDLIISDMAMPRLGGLMFLK